MGFKFAKEQVARMRELEIEVGFRNMPVLGSDGKPVEPTQYRCVCDVYDRWNKRWLMSSEGNHGTKQESFVDALERAGKMNRVRTGKEDSASEVERLKKLVEDQAAKIDKLQGIGKQKQGAA